MSVAHTAEKRRTLRRDAILLVATRLFAQHGYAECEMERLASELGIAKGTVYLYFKSKQELFCACVDEGMQQLKAAIDTACEGSVGLEHIRRAIRAYLCFFDEHSDLVELLMQERAIFKDRRRPTYFEHRDANRSYWRDLYANLQRSGGIRSDLPVDRMLDTIGNLMYGTIFANYFVGRSITLDEQYETLMTMIFEGLRAK